MASNLLQIVQAVSRRTGVQETPSSAFNNPSEEIQRLVSLADEAGRNLAQDHPWQALVKEVSFTSIAGEDQGLVETVAPGFNYIVKDVIWNRTNNRPIYGPHDPETWQACKGAFPAFPYHQYRIREKKILFRPSLAVSQSMNFEYVTRFWIETASQDRFMADTDTPVFDDELMIMSIEWRFKQAEGMDYEALYLKYQSRFEYIAAREGGLALPWAGRSSMKDSTKGTAMSRRQPKAAEG